jgi:hypothetical protein
VRPVKRPEIESTLSNKSPKNPEITHFDWAADATEPTPAVDECRTTTTRTVADGAQLEAHTYGYTQSLTNHLAQINWVSEWVSYFTTDGQSASLSWNKAPIRGLRPDFLLMSDNFGPVDVGRPLWREVGSVFYYVQCTIYLHFYAILCYSFTNLV